MTPRDRRPRPETFAQDTVLVRATLKALPPDAFPDRERRGRPERSPSLPPDNETPPAAPPPAG